MPGHTPKEKAKKRQNVGRKPAAKTLPAKASTTEAKSRAFGQQGVRKRNVKATGRGRRT